MSPRPRHSLGSKVLALAVVLAGSASAQSPPLDFGETVLPDVILTSAAALQPAEVNGDGLTDLLWIEHPNYSRVMLGDGLGGFTLIGGGQLANWFFWSATHGDMDGDGLDDLITGDISATSIQLGVGDGTFALLDVEFAGDDLNETYAADLDADGDPDVVTVWGDALFSAGLEVARNDGTGMVSETYHFESNGRVTQVEAADIDGDGVQDLVASADWYLGIYGAVLLFEGRGNTLFEAPVVVHSDPDDFLVARVADLDNDGWVDLVSSKYDDSLGQYVLESRLNTGGGVFAGAVTVGTGQVRALADLNGDGIADAVLGQVDPSAPPRIARGVGDGTFLAAEPLVTTTPSANPSPVGRLDQNLSWDLLLANSSTKDIHVLLNEQPGSPFETAGPPLAGVAGEPRLWGAGTTLAGQIVQVKLVDAAPTAPVVLVIGSQLVSAPFKGGLLGPAPSLIIMGLSTNSTGRLTLTATWPAGVPFGLEVYLQTWITDAAAVQGRSASNTLRLTAG